MIGRNRFRLMVGVGGDGGRGCKKLKYTIHQDTLVWRGPHSGDALKDKACVVV